MQRTSKLSRLMKMSWEIQKQNGKTRSKALTAAWAIISCENVAIYYLVKKLNHHRHVSPKGLNQFSLFNPSTI